MRHSRLFALLLLLVLPACVSAQPGPAAPAAAVDSAAVMADLFALAADSMEGREAGSEGGARARRYILGRFEEIGLQPVGAGFEAPFSFDRGGDAGSGVNLVAEVPGRRSPAGPILLVIAHYDHVGVRDGEIYNGADDNASGVAGLLAVARRLMDERPEHRVVLAALDAEEMGLRGARAFVQNPPVPLEQIAVVVNMDMISRGDSGELYAAGTHHYPFLKAPLEEVAAAAPVHLLFGHDSPAEGPANDWTMQSDHGLFHQEGIPFIYFGVEDHPDYHRPTDVAERVDTGFFVGAVKTVVAAVERLDAALEKIFREGRGGG